MCCFSLAVFRIFFFLLHYQPFEWDISLHVHFFECIQFGVHWPSSIWRFMSFAKLGTCSAFIFTNIVSSSHYFPFLDSDDTNIRPLVIVPHVYEGPLIFFNHYSVFQIGSFLLLYLKVHCMVPLSSCLQLSPKYFQLSCFSISFHPLSYCLFL